MDVKTVSKPSVPAPQRTSEQRPAAQENRPKAQETQQTNPAKPNPVVNTQGQVTGRHLNVTA